MRHLELHIIQSVPVACLNRDDLNSPKTAIFGGVQRARVSSQSWKRAIREMAKEMVPEKFQGQRTRLMFAPLVKELRALGLTVEEADEAGKSIVDALVKLDSKSKEVIKSTTLYFMSPLELQSLARSFVETRDVKKTLKSINASALKDAADIAIFGRMVANDHSLTVEAAGMFSHALSTHKSDNEIDFFAAVDDLQPKEDAGAGMTSTLEFNSATYYRFAALNLDMLCDTAPLSCMTGQERHDIVKTFLEATIKAVPSARKNTMNANTLPAYVLGVVREKGHHIQLVNAFETPIRPKQGYISESINALEAEYGKLKNIWGVEAVESVAIPETSLPDFLERMVQHVR
jgi:CRISPR system Cascade subunit CasC